MLASRFDEVLLVNPSRVSPATADEVRSAEAELGARLPSGYADYVQRLGDGALGHFVSVYPPANLPDVTLGWRERIREYWFWDTAEAGAEAGPLQERGVLVASSFDGDELCFDPAEPETLFVLPRNEDVAVRVGPGFLASVEWMLSGALNPWVEGWTFEVGSHRAEVREVLSSNLGLSVAAQAIAGLGEHSHLVDLGSRQTFFLPAIEGRLSLYEPEGEDLSMDLTYDDAADSGVVARITSTLAAD